MFRRFVSALAAAALLTPGLALAGPAPKNSEKKAATAIVDKKVSAQAPLEVVKMGNAEVQAALGRKGTTVEDLANTVEGFVDFGELAKRALGKEWEKLNAKQRAEFSETMKGLLRASYAQKAIGQSEADIRYGEQSIEGDEALVKTTLVVKKDAFPVDYRLYREDAKSPWRIYDVITDEVSLVETYKGQFRSLIAKKGYEGLLSTLKAKRDQLEKNADKKVKG